MIDVCANSGGPINRARGNDFVGAHSYGCIIVVETSMLVLLKTLLLQLELVIAELRHEAWVRIDRRPRFPNEKPCLVQTDSQLLHDESNTECAAA